MQNQKQDCGVSIQVGITIGITKEDWKLLLEGLDELKNKGKTGELIGDLFSGLFSPKEGATAKEIEMHEKRIAEREEEKRKKEIEMRITCEKIDLVRAKIVLLNNLQA